MSMIHDWFSDLKSRFGDAPALRCTTTGRVLRFSDLNPISIEPLLVTQASATWEGVLEVLRALASGAAVVPLSPNWPQGRALPDFSALQPGDTVIFTSGSSRDPRAMVIGLDAHLANARGSATRIPLGPGDQWLLNLPLHHVSGFSILFRCLDAGACIVLPDGKSLPAGITHLSMVETQLARRITPDGIPASLKAALVGGGPVGLDLANAAIAAAIPLHLTYGMTETASQTTTTEKLTSALTHMHAGKALPGREVRIDPDGRIQVRGAVMARGWLDASGTLHPLINEDGWHLTNDLGEWDSAGNLCVLGRSDRMIISGGEKIHPEVIERTLMAQPLVQRAVVLPVSHPDYGQRPVAVVHGEWDASTLEKLLEKIAMPDAFLAWPESIPVPDGKITARLRKQLREVLNLR